MRGTKKKTKRRRESEKGSRDFWPLSQKIARFCLEPSSAQLPRRREPIVLARYSTGPSSGHSMHRGRRSFLSPWLRWSGGVSSHYTWLTLLCWVTTEVLLCSSPTKFFRFVGWVAVITAPFARFLRLSFSYLPHIATFFKKL